MVTTPRRSPKLWLTDTHTHTHLFDIDSYRLIYSLLSHNNDLFKGLSILLISICHLVLRPLRVVSPLHWETQKVSMRKNYRLYVHPTGKGSITTCVTHKHTCSVFWHFPFVYLCPGWERIYPGEWEGVIHRAGQGGDRESWWEGCGERHEKTGMHESFFILACLFVGSSWNCFSMAKLIAFV